MWIIRKLNIFVLDKNPQEAAKMHSDQHVRKMILESAQMLCTAHWMTGGAAPYKKTHYNHPCAKWARKNNHNYKWLTMLAQSLCKEFTFRFNKIHKTQEVIEWCSQNMPEIPQGNSITKMPQAMPQTYWNKDVVSAYRQYYIAEKQVFSRGNATWTKRKKPKFINNITNIYK